MRLLSSLTNRIFLASAALAVLCIGAAVYFVNVRVTRQAEAELERGLIEAGRVVEQHRTTLSETFTLVARLVADLPKLKAAVETGDPPTVQPLAADYQARVKSDLFVVTNRTGAVLAAVGSAGSVEGRDLPVKSALLGGETTSFRPHPNGVLQVVTVPISIGAAPPEIMGTLSLGFVLDDAVAARLGALTESEVAFALDGTVRAATLPASERAALSRVAAKGVSRVPLDSAEYVAVSRPLAPPLPGASTAAALILRSRTERLRFLGAIHTALAGTALLAVLVATVLSYAVARTVTRPLAKITAAMREMSTTGDLTRKIALEPAHWEDEDAGLLARTFNTLTDSIAAFQRDAAQRERLSALGRLSTVVAHEVRNPLMIIKASLRVLRQASGSPAASREAVADIDEEVSRLDRVVNEVLDFARPIRCEVGPTDLNALCRDAAEASLAGQPVPGISLRLDPQLPGVTTDGERVRTALVNILSNAREAVAARSPGEAKGPSGAPDVELTTLRANGGVAIVISDRGIGIAAVDLPHVFDPYFTTRRTGTGLGLAIAKNIVEALGGAITVRSRPSEGTEVRIDLPATATVK